ncbi:MAG TPA: hypothetical protein VGX68_21405 [Thermoanaerobaculia bacterium]|nr:hypothetical protein [Thermoanaerobaculia bacterium]
MPPQPPRGLLLLRRAGGIWGIDSSAVDGLAARGDGYRISVRGGALAADEILGVAEDLSVRPPAPWLRRFWPEAPVGLTVHGRLPVVVVDPHRPPAALRLDEGERSDEGRD